ncbi:uncharacterized protein LOC116294805 [Actinia tenebrosa]|uniref:Uncharacterized protein LOC116294805 n=1 Tax=Actinia tenebrosa TaxID=6105 RepID=A0A6P8HS82_ACTTE|nr:uncharacterized protein LOC116294805 [Actinia tenebrosa]
MAALISEFRGGLGQLFQKTRLLTTVHNRIAARNKIRSISSLSDKTPVTSSSPVPPPQKKEPFDNSTYKVNEYYSYNEDSFYDMECEIDATGKRQSQPDPSIPYRHTEPWKKEAKS